LPLFPLSNLEHFTKPFHASLDIIKLSYSLAFSFKLVHTVSLFKLPLESTHGHSFKKVIIFQCFLNTKCTMNCGLPSLVLLYFKQMIFFAIVLATQQVVPPLKAAYIKPWAKVN